MDLRIWNLLHEHKIDQRQHNFMPVVHISKSM